MHVSKGCGLQKRVMLYTLYITHFPAVFASCDRLATEAYYCSLNPAILYVLQPLGFQEIGIKGITVCRNRSMSHTSCDLLATES